MPLPVKIALRYLFGPKSSNVINLITALSILGLTIGTAAILLVLSVFNGLEVTLLKLFNPFNPDLKIEKKIGKTFELDSIRFQDALHIQGVKAISRSLEEIALFQYQDQTVVAYVKGVDGNFTDVSDLPERLIAGKFKLKDSHAFYAVAGLGIANKLGLNIKNKFLPITVYSPREQRGIGIGRPVKEEAIYPSGVFSIQQEFDNKYVVTDLELVQDLLNEAGRASSLEIKTDSLADIHEVQAALKALYGDAYTVKDQYQQEAEFFRLMNIEKWIGFLILIFVAGLIAFNMVGAMWMIVLDKKKDIGILRAMGMRRKQIGHIYLWLGGMISGISFIAGLIIALGLYGGQKYFGWVKVPESFVMQTYPVEMRFSDIVLTFIIITAIGILASIPAMRRARQIDFNRNTA